jgi:DNA-binding transcriptional MerR regulator
MTDMTEQTSGTEDDVVTGTTPENNEHQDDRIFSQKDVDKIVQQRLEKYKKRFSDIDVNEYRSLKSAEEERELEAMKKREEFDKILTQQKSKYESDINTLRQELTNLKVDGTLVNTAAARNAVNPEQVAQLLKGSVGLDETGRPVVFDKEGNIQYDPETAEPRKIEAYVNEWLDSNPHFLRSTPGGVASKGSTGNVPTKPPVDLSSLDMTKAADREVYRKLKAEGKI